MAQAGTKIFTFGLLVLFVMSATASGRLLQTVGDPNCHIWDFHTSTCTQCSYRYYYNTATKSCAAVSDQCRDWSANSGLCTSCYQGYTLVNGECVQSSPSMRSSGSLDPNCYSWDYSKNKCTQCAYRYYFNANGVCTPVSDYCREWNPSTGACTSCYQGFSLSNGACAPSMKSGSLDPNCYSWDYSQNKCSQCAYRYFFGANGVCEKVSDNCREWNPSTGVCTSCYQGYQLDRGDCSLAPPSMRSGNIDPNCYNWDYSQNKCTQCAYRYFFGANGVCEKVSDNCREWNPSTGVCTSCYQGYQLDRGDCSLAPPSMRSGNIDPNCNTWDYSQNKCVKCSFRYFFGANGVCEKVSDNCREWNPSTGVCTSCYQGYQLDRGDCSLAPPSMRSHGGIDPNCNTWDYSQNKCVKCSFRYYFD